MKQIISLSLILAANLLFARTASASAGWSQAGYVTQMYHANANIGDGHGVWIVTSTPIYNDSCSGTPSSYFLSDEGYTPANPSFKEDFALLMAAYLNNRPVSFYISGCSVYGNPLVGNVRVE